MANMWQQLDWSKWLYGLVAGMIGGGSTAVTGAIAVSAIDSKAFELGSVHSIKLMLVMFAFSAGKDMFLFLKQHPLPEVFVSTKVETIEKVTPQITMVTTVEKKTAEAGVAKGPEPPPTPPVDQAKP